jgi:phosphoribosylformylglycinamidine cyclo-ligase
MPGFYHQDDYDLAGFAVGAVERDSVLTGEGANVGDLVLGLQSSGLHSNGFSLVRRLVTECGLRYDQPAPFAPSLTLGEALLTPTRIYVRSCLDAVAGGGVKALAHITGGGLVENIPRVLPAALSVEIDARTWNLPPVFRWLKHEAGLSNHELARTFNCGIGMIVVVAADRVDEITASLRDAGETVFIIGRLTPAVAAPHGTTLVGCEEAWQS